MIFAKAAHAPFRRSGLSENHFQMMGGKKKKGKKIEEEEGKRGNSRWANRARRAQARICHLAIFTMNTSN